MSSRADRDQHSLAVFLDRFLEVADHGDPIAQGAEDIVLEAERLAAVGADKLCSIMLTIPGWNLLAISFKAVKALSRSKLTVW